MDPDIDTSLLLTIHELVIETYFETKDERRRLAEYEDKYFSDTDAGSLLGEVELFSDHVFGVYSRVNAHPSSRNDNELIGLLSNYSLLQFGELKQWLVTNAQHYPKLAAYLLLIESFKDIRLKELQMLHRPEEAV